MSLVTRFLNGFSKNISWQHTVLGDGTNMYFGESGGNSFTIKQTANGWEVAKRNKLTGSSMSDFKSDYESCVQWCVENND